MAFLFTWNTTFEGQPDDTEDASLGAGRIRDLKTAISERLEIDHSWAGNDSDGLHLQVTMPQLATKPTVAANQGAFYCKDASGNTAPYFEDDAGTEFLLATVPSLQALYPVGSVYINAAVSTNPATLFGFGTWEAFGTGRTIVALDSGNTLMDTVGETFGTADQINVTHTHSITDPGHNHPSTPVSIASDSGGAKFYFGAGTGATTGSATTTTNTTGVSVQSAGSTGVNQNYQPSIAVYMWKRTA